MTTFKHLDGEIAIDEIGIYITNSKANLNPHRSVSPSYWSKRRQILSVTALIITAPVVMSFALYEFSNAMALGVLYGMVTLTVLGVYFYVKARRCTLFYSCESIDQVRVYPSGLIELVENRHDLRGKRVQCNTGMMSDLLTHMRTVLPENKIKLPKAWSTHSDVSAQLKGYNGTRVNLSDEGLSVGSIWFSASRELKQQSLPPKLDLGSTEPSSWIWPLAILVYCSARLLDIFSYGLHENNQKDSVHLLEYLPIGVLVIAALLTVRLLIIATKRSSLGGISFFVKSEDIQYIEITGGRVIFGLEYKDGQIVDFEATARVKEELGALDSIYKDLTPVTF